MRDTWAGRDLPVLAATVTLLEDSFMVTVSDIATATGLELGEVSRALDALDPHYVDYRKTATGGDVRYWYVHKATPQARRVVGQWPTPDSLIGALAAELAAASARERDPQRAGQLAQAARLVGDTLRDVAVRAAARVLEPGPVSLARPREARAGLEQPAWEPVGDDPAGTAEEGPEPPTIMAPSGNAGPGTNQPGDSQPDGGLPGSQPDGSQPDGGQPDEGQPGDSLPGDGTSAGGQELGRRRAFGLLRGRRRAE